jgi:hypothetical protein
MSHNGSYVDEVNYIKGEEMNKIKELIRQYERTTDSLTRLGLISQLIKELQIITKTESKKV